MFIKEIFETKIEEKIDPVIKVGERENDQKLASEIGNFVVTPALEQLLEEVLEHYTDTILSATDETGVWISGYFGSGKSHLAKIISLLIENRTLDGVPATERFKSRVPPSSQRHDALIRHLSRISQCNTTVLAFNLNTLIGSKDTPLPLVLLNQYYISKGYSSNHIFAKVIESELDKMGKLDALHSAAERLINKPWKDIQKNPGFYRKKLYAAVCEIAPDNFSTADEVESALKSAESGDLYNIQFLVSTLLADLKAQEKREKKPCRLMLVMDETGQWIGDDGDRLHLLQAFVEEAGSRGQGKIWVTVTTHEDMSSIIRNAKGLKTDMKKIEARFRFKISLTTENIERVLEDRLLKKNVAGKKEIASVYQANAGVLRGMGQLEDTLQKLPDCTPESFEKFYPFFPYHIHLIPDIVKSLRSAGGRGEQLSGSTRTLLAITQDIIINGRREYLKAPVGDLVSFDEVYGNLEGSEVNPDVRKELSRITERVSGATELTQRVAEVLYLIREIGYIPKTPQNLARLLVERTDDDVAAIVRKINPELEKLQKAKIVARIGDDYEFLTKEGRNFEEEVIEAMSSFRWQDVLKGIEDLDLKFVDFSTVPFMGWECPVRIFYDTNEVTRNGDIRIQIYSPLERLGGRQIAEIEEDSTHQTNEHTIFVLSGAVPKFDEQVKYYIAMKSVIDLWKGDPHKSTEAQQLASNREENELKKQRGKIQESVSESLRQAQIIFKGSSRSLAVKKDQTPSQALRAELAQFMPGIYTKYEKVPYQVQKEQNLIVDILKGDHTLTADMKGIKIYDKAGGIDKQSSLLFEISAFMDAKRSIKERVLGNHLIEKFSRPPYGWHQGAIRAGVAALVRSGDMKVIIEKKPFTNPADPALQNALRNSRDFNKVQLEMEEGETDNNAVFDARGVLITLIGKRTIQAIPQGVSDAMKGFAETQVKFADETMRWANAARLPLSKDFTEGKDVFEQFVSLSNPRHVIAEIIATKGKLPGYVQVIGTSHAFTEKWGTAFNEMRDFAHELTAIRFRLTENGRAFAFLKNWDTALSQATIMQDDVWKTLQQSRNNAQMEITELVSQLKAEVDAEISEAETTIRQMLTDASIHEKYDEYGATATLASCKKDLDVVSGITATINCAEMVKRRITQLISSVHDEIAKAKPSVIGEGPQKERIRVVGSGKTQTIKTEREWNTFRESLDKKVKTALSQNKTVELE
jgi:hypothetical protein